MLAQIGAYTPGDGHTDPASSTMAMAAGARQRGAEIYVRSRVVDIARRPGGDWDVVTEQGTIVSDHVVNASGRFAPQIGAMVGIQIPIVNMVHQYLVTEDLDVVKRWNTKSRKCAIQERLVITDRSGRD